MKKLILIGFLIVSNLLIGQTKKEIDGLFNEYETWLNTTKTFKKGDNDKQIMVGLLKDVYTNPNTKYRYAELNPRIGEMMINSYTLSDTISYNLWVNSLEIFDVNKYDFIYNYDDQSGYTTEGERLYKESIEVFDKEGNYITGLKITYNGNNLLSFHEYKKGS